MAFWKLFGVDFYFCKVLNFSKSYKQLNFQQTYDRRNENVLITDESRHRVGKNILINRLNILNGAIKYDWLNLSTEAFKLKRKALYIKAV